MRENCPGSVPCDLNDLQQALSIHTRKITDSCRDKDCIEDLRVYLTRGSQNILDSCAGAKVRCADLLYTYIDVEPVAFDRNHYCVEATFYYRVLADATVGACRPVTLHGVAVFSKRAVLCGEDSRARIFTSDTRLGGPDGVTVASVNRPTAVVEVTDTNSQAGKCDCTERIAILKELWYNMKKLVTGRLLGINRRKERYGTAVFCVGTCCNWCFNILCLQKKT